MFNTKIENTFNKYLPNILRRLACVIIDFIKYIPFNSVMKLRNFCYRFALNEMGENCNICDGVTIRNPRNLSLGKRVSIHPYTMIGAMGKITIGNDCGISSGCTLLAVNHNQTDTSIPMKEQGITCDPITIGNDVFIGANATILGNTKIGEGSFIGAGAVVSGEISPYSIVVGNPGRILFNRKVRFGSEENQDIKKT